MMEKVKEIVNAVKKEFADAVYEVSFDVDIPVFVVKKERLVELIKYLRDKQEFLLFLDLSAIDYLKWKDKRDYRFEVVYHLLNIFDNIRVRVKIRIREGESVPTIVRLYKGADWAERECYDMFGIEFDGHPNLERLLLPKRFPGHPLRKDFPIEGPPNIEEILIKELLQKEGETDYTPFMEDYSIDVSDKERYMVLNFGPSHPATHGTLHNIFKLDGETIVYAKPIVGYVHRAFEKLGESYKYHQFLVCTDRLNYLSSPLNNIGWLVAVEEMLGIEVPKRAQYVRVIIGELARIADHLAFIGVMGVDLGAVSGFLYLFHHREKINHIWEKLFGGRVTTSFGRIGGLELDIYDGFYEDIKDLLKGLGPVLKEIDDLLFKNKIFMDRTKGVGGISVEDALSYGYTGPNLRAAGVPYDLRKFRKYLSYEDFEFDVPIGDNGDAYCRVLVRFEEIKQSMRIIEQAVENIPSGPYKADVPMYVLPEKKKVYTRMASLIHHVEILQKGIFMPEMEHYSATEVVNGELGFYVISDGTEYPYRIRIRKPGFYVYQSYPELVKGLLIADAVAIMTSLHIVIPEVDG